MVHLEKSSESYGCILGLVGVMMFFSPATHSLAQTPSATLSNTSDAAAIYFAPEKEDSPAIDFAELERQYPLTLSQRLHLTPDVLQQLSQEQLDQLYARLTAGLTPDGSFDGMAFLSPRHREHLKLIEQVLEKLGSFPKDYSEYIQNHWMELWQGKEFDRRHMILHNRVNRELAQEIAQRLGPRIEHALHNLPPGAGLFPAKMYCGQSKLDSRRESIIFDYAYNDNLPPSCKEKQYCDMINQLVNRNGLNIRDEIRMIHPGLYLGRVYLGKFFLINFLVMNHERTEDWKRQVMKQKSSTTQMDVQEVCWAGAPYRN